MAFTDIFGHENEKRVLMDYLRSERVPHALLFSGCPGIGKKKMAIRTAQILLCKNRSGDDLCPSCVKVERGVHPDLLMLGGKDGPLSIDEIRQICEEIRKPPFFSHARVAIIDDAHLLTSEAANALLKTLEEPEGFKVFILITSNEALVPVTVRSRCVRVPFSPLKEKEIRDYLMWKEGLGEEKADIVSRISHGSLSSAIFWLKEENFFLRRLLAEWILGTKKSYVENTYLSERVSQEGCEIYLYFLLSLFRDLFVFSVTGDGNEVYNKDLLHLFRGRKVDGRKMKEKMEIIAHTLRMLSYNVNRWALVENLLISLKEEP